MRLNIPYTLYPFSKKYALYSVSLFEEKKDGVKYALYSVFLFKEKTDAAKYALYSVSLFKEKEGCG
jgi:hypothetical protein